MGPQHEVGSMIWVPGSRGVGLRTSYRDPGGSGVGLQGPRGSRGRPTGSQGSRRRPIQGPGGSMGRPTWSQGVSKDQRR